MACMTSSPRARLEEALRDNAEQLESLRRQYDDFVAASLDSNADDEHDPEGATIAFERQQVVALIAAAERSRADIDAALMAVSAGDYGVCEQCGNPIGAERLEARPDARTCITCAAGAGRRR